MQASCRHRKPIQYSRLCQTVRDFLQDCVNLPDIRRSLRYSRETPVTEVRRVRTVPHPPRSPALQGLSTLVRGSRRTPAKGGRGCT